MIKFEIDGKKIQAKSGSTIIEAADAAGVDVSHIPRFCYHSKLSIAASCRMCLVEVENGRKPLPACATTVTAGMKIYTKSHQAMQAQKEVMSFLLINHPLDCPICDQGGECELQDLSMGYGRTSTSFIEGKRSIKDKDIGPLIATEMTRCIHCTRCVRFCSEIAGLRELGILGRGEHSEISTYVEHSMQSELAGNIIDLCPVGALTSKPFRFKARAWELRARAGIAGHDCLGSNINIHIKRESDSQPERIMRVVSRTNEKLNETWLSDRDRFSYTGLYHADRLARPMIKQIGKWQETDWETALTVATQKLQNVIAQNGAQAVGGLISPNSTVEECYLFQAWLRSLGVPHIDHRIRQSDFDHQIQSPLVWSTCKCVQSLEETTSFLLIGSFIREEQPLITSRIRKATQGGARVHVINPVDFDFHLTLTNRCIVSPWGMVCSLAAIAQVLFGNDKKKLNIMPKPIAELIRQQKPNTVEHDIARDLQQDKAPLILLGALAQAHPYFSYLRVLSETIAIEIGAKTLHLTDSANEAGAWLATALPHRRIDGVSIKEPGYNAKAMLAKTLKSYCLFGLEPTYDSAYPELARTALQQAECVIVCSAFKNKAMLEYADVLLPIATHLENEGSFVNIEGTRQSFQRSVNKPFAEARCGWKVLRVLANFMGRPGFDYQTVLELSSELSRNLENDLQSEHIPPVDFKPLPTVSDNTVWRCGYWPIYRNDSLVRRAEPLQVLTVEQDLAKLRLGAALATHLKVNNGDRVSVSSDHPDAKPVTLQVLIDQRIADATVCLPSGLPDIAINGPLSVVRITT